MGDGEGEEESYSDEEYEDDHEEVEDDLDSESEASEGDPSEAPASNWAASAGGDDGDDDVDPFDEDTSAAEVARDDTATTQEFQELESEQAIACRHAGAEESAMSSNATADAEGVTEGAGGGDAQADPSESEIQDMAEELRRGFYPEELRCLRVLVGKWPEGARARLNILLAGVPHAAEVAKELNLPKALEEPVARIDTVASAMARRSGSDAAEAAETVDAANAADGADTADVTEAAGVAKVARALAPSEGAPVEAASVAPTVEEGEVAVADVAEADVEETRVINAEQVVADAAEVAVTDGKGAEAVKDKEAACDKDVASTAGASGSTEVAKQHSLGQQRGSKEHEADLGAAIADDTQVATACHAETSAAAAPPDPESIPADRSKDDDSAARSGGGLVSFFGAGFSRAKAVPEAAADPAEASATDAADGARGETAETSTSAVPRGPEPAGAYSSNDDGAAVVAAKACCLGGEGGQGDGFAVEDLDRSRRSVAPAIATAEKEVRLADVKEASPGSDAAEVADTAAVDAETSASAASPDSEPTGADGSKNGGAAASFGGHSSLFDTDFSGATAAPEAAAGVEEAGDTAAAEGGGGEAAATTCDADTSASAAPAAPRRIGSKGNRDDAPAASHGGGIASAFGACPSKTEVEAPPPSSEQDGAFDEQHDQESSEQQEHDRVEQTDQESSKRREHDELERYDQECRKQQEGEHIQEGKDRLKGVLDSFEHGVARVYLDEKLETLEGYEDAEVVNQRMRDKAAETAHREDFAEVERFLGMMRGKGGGNITLAWRRHFVRENGDGELTFAEFCVALRNLDFVGDTVGLWMKLLSRGGKHKGDEIYHQRTISLDVVDPIGSAVLETFGNWCKSTFGGPVEFFRAVDEDGSDSLTIDEFIEGLVEMGFFSEPETLHPDIRTPEAVQKNLYPLLDHGGGGCVTADEVLFLETDRAKRKRIAQELQEIREKGTGDINLEPLTFGADELLKGIYMRATPMGGKHWSQVKADDLFSAASSKRRPKCTGASLGTALPASTASSSSKKPFQKLGRSSSARTLPPKPRQQTEQAELETLVEEVAADLRCNSKPTAESIGRGPGAGAVGASATGKKDLPPLKLSPHVLDHYTGWGNGGHRIVYKTGPDLPPPAPIAKKKPTQLQRQCYRQSMVPKLLPPVGFSKSNSKPGSRASSAASGIGRSVSAGALLQAQSQRRQAAGRAGVEEKFDPQSFNHWVASKQSFQLFAHYSSMD